MARVRGIREVRSVEVLVPEARRVLVGRVPGTVQVKRQAVDLPQERWPRFSPMTLPVHRGAGPCGTSTLRPSGRAYATWWSVHNLIAPLRAYYASYVPPMRFGAKSTPRGRRTPCKG